MHVTVVCLHKYEKFKYICILYKTISEWLPDSFGPKEAFEC